MTRSWMIGSRPDCDLVVDLPKVSGRHCRLERDADGLALEDLGSTNGTYVNGVRINGKVRVTPGDSLTCGLSTPIPWPPGAIDVDLDDPAPPAARPAPGVDPAPAPMLHLRGEATVIGRDADCDHRLDLAMISGRHARLSRDGDRVWVEDLGSSNGTFVNGRRVEGKAAVAWGDTINLGSHAFVLADGPADDAPGTRPGRVETASPGPSSHGPGAGSTPARTEPNRGSVGALSSPRRLVALLGQAPVAALLVLMTAGARTPGPAAPGEWSRAGHGATAALYWLGVAAVWFGLSDAVLATAVDPTRLRGGPASGGAAAVWCRTLVLGALCVGQCVLAWVIVSSAAGLKGSGLPVLAVLVLSSAVGLGLGLVILAAASGPRTAWSLAALALVATGGLGGGAWPLSRMPPLVRAAADATPSRWAFEGLLLLESDRRPLPESSGFTRDLAEDSFPAESGRMGVRADLLALALSAIGLSAAAGFIARERGRGLVWGREA